jgi:hypothetical protein
MKKSILIAALLFIGLYTNVMADVKPSCYVKTGDKTYYGQKIRTGAYSIKITSDNGSVVKVPIHKVKSYSDGSRLFEQLPTVNDRYDTTGYRIMEYVASNNGLKLFSFYNSELEKPGRELYIYNDERLYLKIDRKNAANVLAFFGIDAW